MIGADTFADYLHDTCLLKQRRKHTVYDTEKTLGKCIFNPLRDIPFLGKIPIHKLTLTPQTPR